MTRFVLCGIGAILLGAVMAEVPLTLGAQSLDKNTDFYVVGVGPSISAFGNQEYGLAQTPDTIVEAPHHSATGYYR